MAVKSNINKFRDRVIKATEKAKKLRELNIKDARYEMELRAKELTPHNKLDNPESGFYGKNTTTGGLASHWGSSQVVTDVDIKVRLTNDMQYASYVENGHKMKKHFVPGLHIFKENETDPGVLYYDEEESGGIVVGTKTKYVKGIHVVPKAKQRFFEVYKMLQQKTIDGINKDLNKE